MQQCLSFRVSLAFGLVSDPGLGYDLRPSKGSHDLTTLTLKTVAVVAPVIMIVASQGI